MHLIRRRGGRVNSSWRLNVSGLCIHNFESSPLILYTCRIYAYMRTDMRRFLEKACWESCPLVMSCLLDTTFLFFILLQLFVISASIYAHARPCLGEWASWTKQAAILKGDSMVCAVDEDAERWCLCEEEKVTFRRRCRCKMKKNIAHCTIKLPSMSSSDEYDPSLALSDSESSLTDPSSLIDPSDCTGCRKDDSKKILLCLALNCYYYLYAFSTKWIISMVCTSWAGIADHIQLGP